MKSVSKAKQLQRLTPEKFLRDLGIRRGSKEHVFTESFYDDVYRAGGNPWMLQLHGTLSPQAGEVFYVNDKIAMRTLSVEYDRFRRLLHRFDHSEGYPTRPGKIADLG